MQEKIGQLEPMNIKRQVKNKSNYEVVYYVHWLQTSSGDSGCLSRV